MARGSLIQELKDRGVLRVTGLYIALAWLSLQIADVVFPAFDIPDSALRYILLAAAAGLPLVALFAWFYEITPDGIVSEDELTKKGSARVNHRGITAATIITLVLALGTSLYVNFRFATTEDAQMEPPPLVSILVSDFENTTGDELFDGSLEPALAIGMEGAPFITAFSRNRARKLAERLETGSTLSEEASRLISLREDIDLVLAGNISISGSGYSLSQRALDPVAGEVVAQASAVAANKTEVLPAVGSLAAQIREALGDVTLTDGNLAADETLTTTSLEAVQFYTKAQNLAFQEKNAEAIELFEKAAAADPDFGRVYPGWALSELKLGRRDRSNELWEKALALIGSTSERERFRTLGVYYAMVTRDQKKSIESYEQLVEKFPADSIGWNNLAVAYFLDLQFDKSLEVGAELANRFPDNSAFTTNYALYAMYAGDFELAGSQASKVLAAEPDYFLAWLPQAISHMVAGDLNAATEDYRAMGEKGARAKSLAAVGLADIAMLTGDFTTAATELSAGRELDTTSGNIDGAIYKGVQLARALAAQGDAGAAIDILDSLASKTSAINHVLPMALLYVDLNEPEKAASIQTQLAVNLQTGHRAAAALIKGAIALRDEKYVVAVDAMNESIRHSDTWLARFYLGRTYVSADYYAEALGEFELCLRRIGETSALFLDDVPTFQYHAPVHYWLGRTRQALGGQSEGQSDLQRYLSLRIESDNSPLTEDARARQSGAVL